MTRGFLRFLRGNTIALLALFIALGGTTYAATALPKNSVGTKQLKKNAVTALKIKVGAVTNAKIGKNAVTGAEGEGRLAHRRRHPRVEPRQGPVRGDCRYRRKRTRPAERASGALTGTYPAPTLGNGVVTAANVVDASQSAATSLTSCGVQGYGVFDPSRIPVESCSSDTAVTGPSVEWSSTRSTQRDRTRPTQPWLDVDRQRQREDHC